MRRFAALRDGLRAVRRSVIKTGNHSARVWGAVRHSRLRRGSFTKGNSDARSSRNDPKMAYPSGRRSFHGRASDPCGPRRSLRQHILDAPVAALRSAGADNRRHGRCLGLPISPADGRPIAHGRRSRPPAVRRSPPFIAMRSSVTGCRGSFWSWPYGASGFSSSVLWRSRAGFTCSSLCSRRSRSPTRAILGGQLVYDYGVGTALYNGGSSSPIPQPEATGPATPIPTVYVPTATATPEAAAPTTAASASETASAMPSAAVGARDTFRRAKSCCTPSASPLPAERHPLPQPTNIGGSGQSLIASPRGRQRMERRKIAVVSALFRYPVKSMLGEKPAELALTINGTLGDRAWAVREASGRIATAKKWPAMLGFRASYDSPPRSGDLAPVTIAFPDGESIHAADPDASARLSEVLGRAVRLERAKAGERVARRNRSANDFRRRSGRTASARFYQPDAARHVRPDARRVLRFGADSCSREQLAGAHAAAVRRRLDTRSAPLSSQHPRRHQRHRRGRFCRGRMARRHARGRRNV